MFYFTVHLRHSKHCTCSNIRFPSRVNYIFDVCDYRIRSFPAPVRDFFVGLLQQPWCQQTRRTSGWQKMTSTEEFSWRRWRRRRQKSCCCCSVYFCSVLATTYRRVYNGGARNRFLRQRARGGEVEEKGSRAINDYSVWMGTPKFCPNLTAKFESAKEFTTLQFMVYARRWQLRFFPFTITGKSRWFQRFTSRLSFKSGSCTVNA